MKPVLFLANAASPHVRQWTVFLRRAGIACTVDTIHAGSLLGDVPVRHRFAWLRRFGRAGELAGYLLLGLFLRLRLAGRRGEVLLHAHNTSGYGLAAWLSGCPYIVTTYGTEIYSAPGRGGLYRRLIQAVLDGALRVTASTPSMATFLQASFALPAACIDAFTLGIDPVFFPDEAARAAHRQALGIGADELVWIYNRRITPLYNTLSVVAAFRRYRAEAGSGRLLLLEGSCDSGYRDQVLAAAAECAAIRLLPGFMDQDALRGWLSAADFALSVPTTDQLSSSILESIACGCVPVLLDNPAYAAVTASPLTVVVPDNGEEALLGAFRAAAGQRDRLGASARGARLVTMLGEDFSADRVCARIGALYAQTQLQAGPDGAGPGNSGSSE